MGNIILVYSQKWSRRLRTSLSSSRTQSTDISLLSAPRSSPVVPRTPCPATPSPTRRGSSVTTLVPPTVSRVTKSRSTPLVCITDTTTSHPTSPGTPTTQQRSEEVSRSSPVLARVATEPCIKSMISLLTKVSSKTSWPPRWSTCQRFTLVIRSAALTTSRSGTSDSAELTTES